MKYQNIQQQVDITAVPENKVCFKYCPRCNKFLFLPFIRPITVQDSKGSRGAGRNTAKFWRGWNSAFLSPDTAIPQVTNVSAAAAAASLRIRNNYEAKTEA